MSSSTNSVMFIEVVGEGKADAEVLPIILQMVGSVTCEIRHRQFNFLQKGKGREQKVKFAKLQAFYNGALALVFVLDSEGDLSVVTRDMVAGRKATCPDFPTAIGIAHPCLESWLLYDASAIRRGLGLLQRPTVPTDPESLPAPCHNRNHNPKTALAAFATSPTADLSTAIKGQIASHTDWQFVEQNSVSFRNFVLELRQFIQPLFLSPSSSESTPSTDQPET